MLNTCLHNKRANLYNLLTRLLTEHLGQCQAPVGESTKGGTRQLGWNADGHDSQHNSSPPSLQTRQNSICSSSSCSTTCLSLGPFSSYDQTMNKHYAELHSNSREYNRLRLIRHPLNLAQCLIRTISLDTPH